jgi:hypothetical protein
METRNWKLETGKWKMETGAPGVQFSVSFSRWVGERDTGREKAARFHQPISIF